jgi:hypothetical protein
VALRTRRFSVPSTATDLDGRRCSAGAAVLHIPVIVIDRDGTEVARFRSPRKLARAIIHGAVIPVDGDTVVGKHVVVS